MDRKTAPVIFFHLHLVSDSTGETLNTVAKAACAQFANVSPIEHIHSLVRSRRQLERVLVEIGETPGLVLFTLMNPELREQLREFCQRSGITALPVLDPVLSAMAGYLGIELLNQPGGQHELDSRYFDRIEALNFAMAHDDGQALQDLNKADVVLVGVSRTSKTPTCIYLANRGYKAANVPLIRDMDIPEELNHLSGPLIIGLIASPERLVQVRRNRLLSLNERTETDYVDMDLVREESTRARRLFEAKGWPVIDVSRRSIEETAAAIINLLSDQADQAG